MAGFTFTVTALYDVMETGLSGSMEQLPVAGRTVYLDLNLDHQFDPGDPSGVTNSQGQFTFDNLAAGKYEVGIVLLPGDRSTAPPPYGGAFLGSGPGQEPSANANLPIQMVSTVLPLTPIGNPISYIQYGNGTNTTANLAATAIGGYYHLMLGRGGSQAEIVGWTNAVLGGTSLQQVASDILNSTEFESNTIASYYTTYLGRAGSPSEIAYWVASLQHGVSEEQIASAFLNSPEYSAKYADPASFVDSLYLNLLDRNAAASETSFWVGQLAGGMSRSAVIAAIQGSPEALGLAITADYTTFLARLPSASEVDAWLPLLAENGGSLTLAEVAADIAGSPAYAARAGTFLSP